MIGLYSLYEHLFEFIRFSFPARGVHLAVPYKEWFKFLLPPTHPPPSSPRQTYPTTPPSSHQTMSKYNSTLASFDPFAEHPFTSVSSPSAEATYHGGNNGFNTSTTAAGKTAFGPRGATLPSPPPSPSRMHLTPSPPVSSSGSEPIPINMHSHMNLGSKASYNDHVTRAMNAPPQSMLASPDLPAPSWPDITGMSTPLSPSSSSGSSSSSSSATPRQQQQSPATHVFTDFRAEVDRYQRESDDFPVLKKKRDRVYPGF